MGDRFNRRFRAVLALRGLTITMFAAKIAVNPTHLGSVIAGRVPLGDHLRQRLQQELGAAAWAFAVGEADPPAAALEIQAAA